MVTKEELDIIHKSVPVEYYQNGIKNNLLQRYWHKRRFKLLTKEIGQLQLTGRILDVGCHSGDLTKVLKDATNCSVVGIDISPNAIDYAKSRFSDIDFICSDFPAQAPFESGHFQAITTFDVMEHIPETDKVMDKIKDLLHNKGYFVMAVPNENFLFKFIWFFWTRLKGEVWDDAHVHDFRTEGFGVLYDRGFTKIVDKKIIFNMWHFLIFQLNSDND